MLFLKKLKIVEPNVCIYHYHYVPDFASVRKKSRDFSEATFIL